MRYRRAFKKCAAIILSFSMIVCTACGAKDKVDFEFSEGVKEVTSQVRKVIDKPLIVKLTPNVTDIASIAKAVEDAGADGIHRKPRLAQRP